MVRIVNGEIVEDKPKDTTPSGPKRHRRPLLPSTRALLGGLCYSVPFLNYEFDLLWFLSLFLIGYTLGGKSFFILLAVLLIFKNISSKYHSTKSHIGTLNG